MQSKTAARTPEAIIVYPSLFSPESYEGGPEYFKCTLLFEKHADLSELEQAIRAAAERKFPNKSEAFYTVSLRTPIRNGDVKAVTEDGEPDEGSFYYGRKFISCKTKHRPDVVDIRGIRIDDEDIVYGGCKVLAYLSFFGYDHLGNKGVGCTLQAVVKLAEGDPIGGGRVRAVDVFSDIIRQTEEELEDVNY